MKIRRTSRIILLDEGDRILLFKIEEANVVRLSGPPSPICWITPGGGLEHGESFEECALRELWEETGLTDVLINQCIAICEPIYIAAGEKIQGHDRFYLARVNGVEVTLSNMYEPELSAFRDHQWWTVDDLHATKERIVPRNLAKLMKRIVGGDIPIEPIQLPD